MSDDVKITFEQNNPLTVSEVIALHGIDKEIGILLDFNGEYLKTSAEMEVTDSNLPLMFSLPKPKELANSEFDKVSIATINHLSLPVGSYIKLTVEIFTPEKEH